MGQAGRRAKHIKRPSLVVTAPTSEQHPWDAPGLTRAERVVSFIESLPCTSGFLAGTKFQVRPWQRDFIEAVYRTDADGKRLVRTALLSMARGNGKTGLAACLALAHLCGPEAVTRGEVYSAANDRWQAGRIFSEMVAMVENTPWLAARVAIRRGVKELEDIGGTKSFYAALSRESGTKHGLSPTCVIYDEYGQTGTPDLYDALQTAMGKQPDPLMLVISTQAPTDQSPLSTLIDHGLRCQNGEIQDSSFHLVLYAAPMTADIYSPDTWLMANPALSDFRSYDDIVRLAHQARHMPASENAFRNLVLNQRIAATSQFITASAWAACGSRSSPGNSASRPCFAGLDLAASRDLTALVLVFGDDKTGYDVLPFFWLPGDDLLERGEADRVPYDLWRRQGRLLTVPGKTMDPEFVARKLAELHAQYDIKMLGYDRWRVEDLKRELGKVGTDIPLLPHGQGYKDFSHAVNELERCVVAGKLRHGGHPILQWCVLNARTTQDAAGNRKLDKSKSTGRIDGAVALAMALSVASRHVEDTWEPLVMVV
jgi:phage terminase large subunit-like protein